ncbi:TPA: phage tail tape measure protein [Streptococcus equi subsp. zooepidemicus]|nr:phage tail tape measure protein [Streptococcus equi subsp. zooepidemicus]HEL0568042.1 phage tail tape measure protein [Streptococcus equi subsp. zooepidemicus]HEL0587027.1 phage tail tape measure protein [Streptococcus equi subsp. zooepidemicus]HEL1038307.1 phage tail tape measure protein [Streptococcus equi subsp. zooepidemicus]HEL1049966.1 phage tail tape measure protein [Streptococcus equi subsp. zooepidemicus]
MANRIKGITVEIGGDTTGLDKALKGVNSTIKNTQSQLRDVNRLLKLDPSNAKLLAQKQQLLQKEISETKSKLDALKEADKQAQVQLENGELGQDKYDALQREIIETENSLKALEEEAKKVPSALSVSMKEAGDKIKAVGDKTTEVGKGLSTHVTAPIVAMGAASLAAFNEVDKGMDVITQKTGASGKVLKEMQDSMKNLATSIPTDFETAGSAIGEVNTRFGLTGKKLEELSGKFIKFAQLNNTDVSTAIDNTQKVISAFGLKAEDAGALLDTMNAVGQRTGISMGTLAKSMVTNSASLQQLGFSASDAANFLGNVEMSGADTSQVMTGLSKALSNATANGKPMKEALKDIQDSMVNAKSDTEGLEVAISLFGKKAGPAIYQACKNGSLSFEELGTSLKDNLGNVDSTFNETLDPIDKFKTSMNSLKIVGADVGNSLMTVLQPMLEKFAKSMKSLSEKWNSLSPGMQQAIVKIALIAATVGPVLVVIGKVITAVGTITSALGGLIGLLGGTATATTAVGVAGGASAAGTAAAGTAAGGAAVGFGALNVSLLPIIGIIAAIIAAVIAIIAIIKNWGAITEWFKGLWETVSTAIMSIWQGISDFFKGIWEGLVSIFTTVWETIKNVLTVALMFIVELIKGYFELITLPFRFIWENCKETIMTVWEANKTVVSTVLNTISQVITSIMNAIKTVITTVWNAIKTVITTVINAILSVITTIFNTIKNVVTTIWNAIKSVISTVVDGIKSKVNSVFNAVSSTVSSVFNGIKSAATSIWNGIKNAIVTPIEVAKNKVKSVVDAIKGFFSSIKLKLPHIKLPHFSIKGHFSLAPPSVPHLSIDWYKKAMNEPMLLNGATIFGSKGGHLLGGGEAGPEVIMGLDTFSNMTAGANGELLSVMSRVLAIMDRYFPQFAETSIVLDSGELVGGIAPKMDMELYKLQNRKARGW